MKALLSVLVLISVATPAVHAGVKSKIANKLVGATDDVLRVVDQELIENFNKALISTRENARRAAQKKKRELINNEGKGSLDFNPSASSLLKGTLPNGSRYELAISSRTISATDDKNIFSSITFTTKSRFLNEKAIQDAERILSYGGRRAETFTHSVFDHDVGRFEVATTKVIIDKENLNQVTEALVKLSRAIENGEIGARVRPALSRSNGSR